MGGGGVVMMAGAAAAEPALTLQRPTRMIFVKLLNTRLRGARSKAVAELLERAIGQPLYFFSGVAQLLSEILGLWKRHHG